VNRVGANGTRFLKSTFSGSVVAPQGLEGKCFILNVPRGMLDPNAGSGNGISL
jgi:hypothetical protein